MTFFRMTAGVTLIASMAACAGAKEESANTGADSGAALVMIAGAASPTITVYKTPTCGCCTSWVEHLKQEGFKVVAVDTADVSPIKRALGIGEALASCHTALVDGYVIEGHVPAADIARLLRDRPAIVGLAVPGMPMGSPGMEGPRTERYSVLGFDKAGAVRIYASH